MEQQQSFAEDFRKITGALTFGIYTVGSFWSLCVKKWGTVGTRTYWMEAPLMLFVLAVLAAGTFGIEGQLFYWALFGFAINYGIHFWATVLVRMKGVHVHSYGLGKSIFPKHGQIVEVLLGALLGVWAFVSEAPIFGGFLMASTFCTAVGGGIVVARDRMRVVQMQDAMQQQQYESELLDERMGNRV